MTNTLTYDCYGRIQSPIRVEHFRDFQLGEGFVRVGVVRCPFHPSVLPDNRVPADYAVQNTTVIL